MPQKSTTLLRLVLKEIETFQRWHRSYTKKVVLCPLLGSSQKTKTLQQVQLNPLRIRNCQGVGEKGTGAGVCHPPVFKPKLILLEGNVMQIYIF